MPSWPKPYLLQILSAAVTHGSLYVEPITAEDALSLRMSLLRVRRRADTANRSFIIPEYHLVTVMNWEFTHIAEGKSWGRLPVIYNNLPSTLRLPDITIPHGPPPTHATRATPTPSPTSDHSRDLIIDPADIPAYIASLTKRAQTPD
jgi:hypothetical protein